MPAATLLLIARGAKDKHLTVNPQFSYWRFAHRRHPPFAMAMTEMTTAGDTGWGGLCRIALDGRGDLVHDCFLSVELPALSVTGPGPSPLVQWCPKLGHALVEYVELAIGGEVIERQTGEFMEVFTQLTMTADRKHGYNNMIGHKGSLLNPAASIGPQLLYIPLGFWFCNRSGCALPLLAIQCQEVEIRVKFRQAAELYQTNDAANVVTCGALENVSLFANYVYLSEPERRMFLNNELNYLMEQVQINEPAEIGGPNGTTFDLDFAHPVKELFFVCQRTQARSSEFATQSGYPNYNDRFNYSSSAVVGQGSNMVDRIYLKINGMDVADSSDPQFFNLYQPWRYHTGAPDVGVFCYSFALKPEDFQPSGHADFTRFQTANLKIEFNDAVSPPCYVSVYAWGYNVLTVKGGQAALEYVC